MLLHVDVTPDPDEPTKVTRDQIRAGLAWLHANEALGIIERFMSRRKTGGYMDVRVPSDDEDVALAQLDELLADYPLLGTVSLLIYPMFDTPDEGFDVLEDAHVRGVRIDAPW